MVFRDLFPIGYTPKKRLTDRIAELKENKAFWCIGKKDVQGNDVDLKLFGSDSLGEFRRLEIYYMPCLAWKAKTQDLQNKATTECYNEKIIEN